IFKTDVTTTDGGLILVSQCDDDKTIFSLTCNEFGTTYSNQKGIGPAVDRLDDMYSMGKGKLLVSLRAYVPSAFDKSVAADWVGYYLVDIRTGDRAFIRGYDPFDGNLGAGYYGGHAVTDVEGDRMLRHNFTNQFFEAINYRQATDVATGETYYPVDRVFIAH
ncbi:MAG: hypothetical protein KY410_09865, partial [Proteobacteria bacterium]|nr:hypothetical protein [Pseudomonadota bacterium]